MYITGTNASSTKPSMAQWILVKEDDYLRYLMDETTDVSTQLSKKGKMRNNSFFYDLQGRRVLNPMKRGIYIIQGKKVAF